MFNKNIYTDMNILKDGISYPAEIARHLISMLDNSFKRECYDPKGVEECLYFLKACAENEKNHDYFRQLYNLLSEIEQQDIIPF